MDLDLVGKLKAKQKELTLSDAEMGEKLGVTRQAWDHVRRGRRRMGLQFIQGVMRGFPDLTPTCLIFLTESATELAETANEVAIDSAEVA